MAKKVINAAFSCNELSEIRQFCMYNIRFFPHPGLSSEAVLA